MDYSYGQGGFPVARPNAPVDRDTAMLGEFNQTTAQCITHHLLLRRFSVDPRGYAILAPILVHLSWTATGAEAPADAERDALHELLLRVFKPKQTMCMATEFIVLLFTLFSDTVAFGRTRMGAQLLSDTGGQTLRAVLHDQPFTEREVLLFLTVLVRDRLLTRGDIIRGVGLRLSHGKRAEIAARLGNP